MLRTTNLFRNHTAALGAIASSASVHPVNSIKFNQVQTRKPLLPRYSVSNTNSASTRYFSASRLTSEVNVIKDFENPETYKLTTKGVLEAHTINPDAYRNADFFKKEQENVYGKSWVCVGTSESVKNIGDTITVDVGGQPIFVTRDKKGQVHGFHNVCRHRGSRLVVKNGRYPAFTCPYHRWAYAPDGRLITTPMWATKSHSCGEGDDHIDDSKKKFDKKDFSLFPVQVEVWGCLVFVNMDMEAPSFSTCMGDVQSQFSNYPLDELVVARKGTYDAACNWKILVENFAEYYHLPAVHPELCTVSGVDDHHRRQGPGQYMGFVTSPITQGGTPLDVGYLPSYPGLQGDEGTTAVFHVLFPNVFYFAFPNHFFVIHLDPHSEDRTIEHANLLVHPNAMEDPDYDQKIDKMFEFYDMVNKQDIGICERVQQGVQCEKYRGGRMSYRFEEPIHRFQNMLIDHMVGQPGKVPGGDSDIPYYIGGQGAK